MSCRSRIRSRTADRPPSRQSGLSQSVVEIGQNSATPFTEGLSCEDGHRYAFGLLGTGRSDETGEDDDVGDVALTGGSDLESQQVAGRRCQDREARTGP